MLVLGRTKIKYYGLSGVFRNSPYFFTDIRLLKNIRKINWKNAERNNFYSISMWLLLEKLDL
jgi:hypothetical protein